MDREWLGLSPGHQRNQSGHVLVGHQRGEDLGQLSLQVGVELGLDVEAVHVGEYRDDTTQGMEVLDQSLKIQKGVNRVFQIKVKIYPVELVDERVVSNITQLVGPLAESDSNKSLVDTLGNY